MVNSLKIVKTVQPIHYAQPETKIDRGRRALHIVTWLLALGTFPLIWMGGLVTSHGAGMSVPDWPNSFGYNMFALPFDRWLGDFAGGVMYEHTHRLLGTLVGLLAIASVAFAFGTARNELARRVMRVISGVLIGMALAQFIVAKFLMQSFGIPEDVRNHLMHGVSGCGSIGIILLIFSIPRFRFHDRTVRLLTLVMLASVIIQGVMGGLRVTEVSITLAKLHGIFGQFVFAFAGVLVVMTSRWWMNLDRSSDQSSVSVDGTNLRRLIALSSIILMFVTTQLVLGILMRHDPLRQSGAGAGLAIPDWPLHYGKILPPINEESLKQANWQRFEKFDLAPNVTLGRIWLHFSHRIGAYVTSLMIILLGIFTLRKLRHLRSIWPMVLTLVILVSIQVTLGVLTVLWKKPADVATAHQATGALVLLTATVLVVRSGRLYSVLSIRQTDGLKEREALSAEPVLN